MVGREILALLWMYIVCAACASLAAAQSSGQLERKFHAGHYVALTLSDDDEVAMRRALRPGVAGVQKRYSWRELEPAKDVYDFSAIAADLVVMDEAGAQLVAFVNDKSFRDERFTPEYLWADYTLPIRSPEPGSGYVSKRWDPFVVARMNKLLIELGKAFDGNPRFEGVALQESALGIDAAVLAREGYSALVYRDALIDTLANARRAMPQSQIFWYMNFLAEGQPLLQAVSLAATGYGIALGGPDVLPDSASLQKHVYPLLESQRDSAVLFTSAQNDSFRHEHVGSTGASKYWTPLEIFEFARDRLGVQYLFWNDVQNPRPTDSYGIADAYPVIAANPNFNNAQKPATRPGAVSPTD